MAAFRLPHGYWLTMLILMNIKKTKGRSEIYEKMYILARKWAVNLKSEKRVKGSCNC